MAHDGESNNLVVRFDGEVGDVTDAEVQLIESILGDLIQGVLLSSNEEE